MIRAAATIALALLAGCGVDGEPVKPVVEAEVGLSSSGARAAVAVTRGPMTIYLGR